MTRLQWSFKVLKEAVYIQIKVTVMEMGLGVHCCTCILENYEPICYVKNNLVAMITIEMSSIIMA